MSDVDVIIVGLILLPIFIIFVTVMDRIDEKRDEQRRREIHERLIKEASQRLEARSEMAKEKKLTREQRKVLNDNGIEDTSTWVYLGTQVYDNRGSKSLARNEPKKVIMVFKDTATGIIENITVQE